ncbi:MAG: hypothetical protein AAF602_33660, partial [Myxococcota bacterium]
PTAAGWDITMDAFFDQPTRRSSLLTVADGEALVLFDDEAYCEDELYFDEGAARWMADNGFGVMRIPESAQQGSGPYPTLIDPDRAGELVDDTTEEPIVLTEPLLEVFR